MVLFLLARIVKTLGEQYNRDKFRNPFLERGLLEMSQKVREIVIIVFGVTSGANAIYQLVFRQDIVLFFMSAMFSRLAFYTWVNRDNPDKLKRINFGGAVIIVGMLATIAFILIMNHFFGFEQWESWQKFVVRVTFIFGLATVVNRYFKKIID